MAKKIAVLVRGRQAEALRMAVGIILLDDIVDVYVLDREIEQTEQNLLNLETMKDMDMKVFSNVPGSAGKQYIANEDLAEKLLAYDHIVPY